MKIAVASDHAGFETKQMFIHFIQDLGHEVKDFGCHSDESCDYPDYAHPAAQAVEDGECDRAVLVCGSGVGMVITANRHPGVRAFACRSEYLAEMSRKHNNANVICFAARRNDPENMKSWLKTWLDTSFDAGRHQRRLNKVEKDLVAK